MDRRTFLHAASIGVFTTSASVLAANEVALAANVVHMDSSPPTALPKGSLSYEDFVARLNAVAPFDGFQAKTDTSGIIKMANVIDATNTGLPNILKPIDVGADEFLTSKVGDRLSYSPFDVEYRLSSLLNYIDTCLELREKAQQLELLSIASRVELMFESAMIEMMVGAADLAKDFDHRTAGTMIDPKINGAMLSGVDDKDYKDRKNKIDISFTDTRRAINSGRAALLNEPGSGSNFEERFSFLKESFKRNLTEAYLHAQAVWVGLNRFYNYKIEVPAPKPVGYLSDLSNWAKDAAIELEKKLTHRGTTTVLIALRKTTDGDTLSPIADGDFTSAVANGILSFKITEEYFKSSLPNHFDLKSIRMKGLEAFIWSDPVQGSGADAKARPQDFLRLNVKLPPQDIVEDGGILWSSQKTIPLPAATYPEGAISPQPRIEVNNHTPLGDWSIILSKNSILGKPTSDASLLKNIVLAISVSFDLV